MLHTPAHLMTAAQITAYLDYDDREPLDCAQNTPAWRGVCDDGHSAYDAIMAGDERATMDY